MNPNWKPGCPHVNFFGPARSGKMSKQKWRARLGPARPCGPLAASGMLRLETWDVGVLNRCGLTPHQLASGLQVEPRTGIPIEATPLPPPRAASGSAVISTCGLTKRYGLLTALRGLDLEVEPGEIFGFLGLNGAGKTTAIRLLLDFIRPSAGQARIFGYDCWSQSLEVRARVGYLPGELGLYLDLTGVETLDFLAGLGRQPVDRRRRQELCDRLELAQSDLRRRLREYSTGMKRKLGIIQAFQTNPPLLILDEPTEGLDPIMQGSFYDLLAEVKRAGATVFMSSHVLSEVERVCDRIGLLRKGELVLLATVQESRRLAPRTVRVVFSREVQLPNPLPAGHEVLEAAPRLWRLRVAGSLGPLLEVVRGLPVLDLDVQEARLEDVVLKYYREDET